MLRYYVAWNFWMFAVVALLVGRGFLRGVPAHYSVFGWPVREELYWLILGILVAATAGSFWLWLGPRKQTTPPRGFEVLPKPDDSPARK